MSKRTRRLLMVLLLAIFCAAGVAAVVLRHQYRASEALYENAAQMYTRAETLPAATPKPTPAEEDPAAPADTEEAPAEERCPISVDFEALRAVNPDVVGWLYCEGTVINYPVLQGRDNDSYLHHTYDGSYNAAGSIFVEAANRPGFADANTIIYGHNMKSGIMFAGLPSWANQDYYEAHPVFWLLTPEQDYCVELFSGYVTAATSDTYTIFTGPGEELMNYLRDAAGRSDFKTEVFPESGDRCVVLSTCVYVFEQSRYVLHGVLRPVPSAE